MVPIFTYRDERKLLALAGTVIVAALVALLQLDFARSGRTSPLTAGVTSIVTFVQLAAATIIGGTRDVATTVASTPGLASENARLRAENERLARENLELNETLARVPLERDLARAQEHWPAGIAATVIGFDPEAATHVVTIDKGARDGVKRDDGVVAGLGVVGRIVEVDPFSSKVLLVTDATSRLPAVVQRGRWWSIAVGTQQHVKLQYVSQDAKLKVGDLVVTGEGRSFHAGVPIGNIIQVEPAAAGALDRTAVVAPVVRFGSLSRVLVVSK